MQLKILITSFESLPPLGRDGPEATRERTLVRDVMEVAVFLSAREGDEAGFQRHMAQVRFMFSCIKYSFFAMFCSVLSREIYQRRDGRSVVVWSYVVNRNSRIANRYY